MPSLSKLRSLTLQNQLRLMTGISLLGMFAVILFLMINLNQLRQEFATYQSMQTMDKSLIEIKAGALAISRADPILADTAAQLDQTDTRIQQLIKHIAATTSGTPAISSHWNAYILGFKGAVKIATESPADALQIPDSLYSMHLVPMVSILDGLVAANNAIELDSEKKIAAVMSNILWVVLLPLILMGVLTSVSQTLFGHHLRRRLDYIASEISHLHSGDLSRRLPVSSPDEIGQMSKTINNFISRFESVLHGVHCSADQTHKTAHDVSQMAHSVTENARAQSSKVFQVSDAIESLGETIKIIASKTSHASDAVLQTSALIQSGSDTGRATLLALGRIDQTVSSSVSTLHELNRALGHIGSVSSLIKEIADQTNLLALNAAIEAARAGDQGRGFAVVADEVRKLAERTASATQDIAHVIQTIESQTGQATRVMKQANQEVAQGIRQGKEMEQLLLQINHSIQTVTQMMNQIAAATENQSAAGELICRNIDSVATISASTASDIEQARNEMRMLAHTSKALYETVGQFKLAKAA
jgi:methyl-accepting chemotaxis protein